jgi:hypothetical protein
MHTTHTMATRRRTDAHYAGSEDEGPNACDGASANVVDAVFVGFARSDLIIFGGEGGGPFGSIYLRLSCGGVVHQLFGVVFYNNKFPGGVWFYFAYASTPWTSLLLSRGRPSCSGGAHIALSPRRCRARLIRPPRPTRLAQPARTVQTTQTQTPFTCSCS